MTAPEVSKSEALAALLINPLPPPARMSVLLDEAFCSKLGISPQFWFPLGAQLAVETVSLHDALRAAVSGRKTTSLVLKSGKKACVKLSAQKSGTATLIYKKEGFAFSNADLLSAQRRMRLRALKRVLGKQPLTASDEEKWRSIAELRPFTDREYDELMTTVGETPEAFRSELLKPQALSTDSLMPDSPDYYERLVAKLEKSTDLESFIGNELATARASILARSPARALRRIAHSALWQPLVPFDLLAHIGTAALSPLLKAEDPFSLLFGFEVCRAQLEKEAAFTDLGAAFLEKLFANSAACESRCEIFAASALIATIHLRRSAKTSAAPVFWARLVALTHAGVVADALGKMPNSKGFLRWAARNFGPAYFWNGVVDRREAPRWRPEWITPDHLFAELVGRASGALYMLAEEKRPASWVAAIDMATARLVEGGNVLTAAFPGPFDDFRESQFSLREPFKEVEQQLERATHLEQVPGVVALAYATQPSETVVANVLRILKLMSERPVGDAEQELRYLKAAAHIAIVARSEPMAEAVIGGCFSLARDARGHEPFTDIFAVMAESCAVHGAGPNYRKAVGETAARVCFALDHADTLLTLLTVFEILIDRDERLAPALAKARAIARTKSFRR